MSLAKPRVDAGRRFSVKARDGYSICGRSIQRGERKDTFATIYILKK